MAEAAWAYRHTLRYDPRSLEARNNLATLYATTGRPTVAVDILEGLLRDYPQLPALHVNLGRAYEDAGQPARAAEHYLTALQRMPGDAGLRGDVNRALGAMRNAASDRLTPSR